MTIAQFIDTYTNKFVERYDLSNKNQCVDLVLQFVDDVMAMPTLIPLGINPAYDLWYKTHKLSPHVLKLSNTPQATPKAGDIVVWDKTYGPAGHTAIATGKATTSSFEVLSQNDPLGKPCIIKSYNYNHVLGWLRPKSLPIDEPVKPPMNDQDKKDIESMRSLRKYNGVWYESKHVIADYESRKAEVKKLQDESGAKSKEITTLKKAVEVAQNKAEADLAQAQVDCSKKIADITDKNRIDMENIETRHKEEIKRLKEEGNTTEVPVETPLNVRFRDKSANQKLLAILEIMGA